ncbi:phage late control D family protein [Pasteurella multocida subsp. multocida]|uniref:Phage late control D family protein n=1 Tax=Pasteurella multocida TaxID=747 RepID=A0A9X3UNS8_PASMD|nr:phage late control D family protein [Pasteurella multocida]MBF6979995.1 phage late control D family protein [Pasteurella multocida]MDA5618295.1 phage late control D family protein [Pasteurella multocida subsp. multocida]MDA5619981.1 phage late control D family protein [Pasteurella multocida subsp. multocida]MDA5622687.1 phage late control D family protein [Pasteurella multocida]ODS44600.1 phage tail protein [Pasteurella multocida]
MIIDELINATNHRKPAFRIIVKTKDDKKDITQLVTDRLINLTLTDNRGFEADLLDLELSDHDGKLAIPQRNATIEVAIGWKGKGLIEKGEFSVDEIQFSGAPDKLNIRARSADLKSTLSEKKERSFHKIKIGELVKQIATDNKLKEICADKFKSQLIEHIDQQNESDINLLSRIAEQYDAIATVKNGALLFIERGKAKTASGKDIPQITITKKSGDNYTFTINESDNYKAVRAYWHNLDNGKKGEVIIDENTDVQRVNRTTKKGKQSKLKKNVIVQTQPLTSDSEQIKTLRHTYKTEASAIQGAKAAFDKMKRGVASFSLTMAYGEPELMPEMPAELKGFKTEIDSSDWIITSVTHNITDSGFTSAVEFELKQEEQDKQLKKDEN